MEALSLIFGVKKFHMYLYGKSFTLLKDHILLMTLFGAKKLIPTLAAARMQRWSLILSTYDYSIEYPKSIDHANADALSDELPVMAKDISEATRKDPILSKVVEYTQSEWPNKVTDDKYLPYYRRRN